MHCTLMASESAIDTRTVGLRLHDLSFFGVFLFDKKFRMGGRDGNKSRPARLAVAFHEETKIENVLRADVMREVFEHETVRCVFDASD